MKTLYIMRHGNAEPTADGGDFHRRLTATGARDVLKVGSALNALGGVDIIVHSPLVRTTLTAGLVAEQMKPIPDVIMSEALRSGASADEMIQELDVYLGFEKVLFIGHMPDVAEFSCKLGSRDLLETTIFSPGSVVACSFDAGVSPGSAQILWSHQPATIQDAVRF
jgi:phosphohistidine phosphatase